MRAKAVGVGALAHIALEFIAIYLHVMKALATLALRRYELMAS